LKGRSESRSMSWLMRYLRRRFWKIRVEYSVILKIRFF
jgi:hypothetical protein